MEEVKEIKIKPKSRKISKTLSISEEAYNEIINDFGSLTEFFEYIYRIYHIQKGLTWAIYILSFVAMLAVVLMLLAVVLTSQLPKPEAITAAGGALAMLVNSTLLFASLIMKSKSSKRLKVVKNARRI